MCTFGVLGLSCEAPAASGREREKSATCWGQNEANLLTRSGLLDVMSRTQERSRQNKKVKKFLMT